MSSLAAMFGGSGEAGGFGGLGGGAPPVEDPETAYASQLTQLQARLLECILHCKQAPWHFLNLACMAFHVLRLFRKLSNCDMICDIAWLG